MAKNTFIFTARYRDRTKVGIWAHPDFGSQEKAVKSVMPAAEAIGKLPTFMRKKLHHVVIHRGDETAFGEREGHFFVLYSENIKTRIRNHDLEETVFHESVHATLDKKYARSKKWRAAQKADGDFVTKYAKRNPEGEDLAESGLFAWTLIMHPGRLPEKVEAKVRKIMPHRIAFFEKLSKAKDKYVQQQTETQNRFTPIRPYQINKTHRDGDFHHDLNKRSQKCEDLQLFGTWFA